MSINKFRIDGYGIIEPETYLQPNFQAHEFFWTSVDNGGIYKFSERLWNEFAGHPQEIKNSKWRNLLTVVSYLQMVRARYDKPIIIQSGIRTKRVNSAVGGSSTSYHLSTRMDGAACDFKVRGVQAATVAKAFQYYPGGMGVYKDDAEGWLHWDNGRKARW